MRKLLIFLPVLILFSNCSFLEDDGLSPIEKERLELKESEQSYKVLCWKYLKMSQKVKLINNTTYPELVPVKEKFNGFNRFGDLYDNKAKNNELSASDYITIYQEFIKIKEYVKETDEDILPSMFELNQNKDNKELTAIEIKQKKSTEHLLASVFATVSRDLGRDIALYEIMKIDIENEPESEGKCVFRLFRALLFFEKGMPYLAEEELTKNIKYIETSREADFSDYYWYLYGKKISKQQAQDITIGIHYLLRGIDRLIIGGEKEAAALNDLQGFLNVCNHLGVQTELTLAIETYLHLKNEDAQKAITSLQQLKQSSMLSDKEKKSIDEAIGYLKNRESGTVLNTVYDKYFLSKIVMKYIWNTVKELDWKRYMKEKGFENVDAVFDNITKVQDFIKNIEQYTKKESIEEAGKQLKEESEKLWDKAKNYWNEN